MIEPDPIKILKEARDLLTDPIRWTKGALARDHKHNQTDPWSDRAICFCAIGAVHHVVKQYRWKETTLPAECLILHLEDHLPQKYIYRSKQNDEPRALAIFNDEKGTTHRDLITLFDKTISNLEQN